MSRGLSKLLQGDMEHLSNENLLSKEVLHLKIELQELKKDSESSNKESLRCIKALQKKQS